MASVRDIFVDRFGGQPRLFRAPGRVNLIGEHTDYNDGFVMPMAISFDVTVAVKRREDRKLRLFSESFAAIEEIDLDEPAKARGVWTDYIQGVAIALEAAGHRLRGVDMVLRGSVPMGAGLSSSAAIEVASGFAMSVVNGIPLERPVLARIGQSAENDFVGMRCGIMDQFISACGRAGQALLLDCRTLAFRGVPLPDDVRVVVFNSMVKHALAAGSGYNERRADCEEAARQLGVPALRDATKLDGLEGRILKRARHVVTENARVLAAGEALEAGNVVRFGELMWQSHDSMRDDFDITCDEIDLLVRLARDEAGAHGSRMTGGGFGGCTVSLVETSKAESFVANMKQRYEQATGQKADAWICAPAQGVHEVTG